MATQRVTQFFTSAVRWAARQMMLSLVVVMGAVIGWWGRKATGPVLVSEQVHAAPVVRAAGRPPPVVPTDPVAREWLADATRMSGPSASLLALREHLEAGSISDFGRLARSLICHPLPIFRSEALALLLPAWGRAEPAEALDFIQQNYDDVAGDPRRPGSTTQYYYQIAHSWAGREPMAAMRHLSPERCEAMGLDWHAFISPALASPGDASQPGFIERLKLLASLHGERSIGPLVALAHSGPWEQAGRLPSADEWRALAGTLSDERARHAVMVQAYMAWHNTDGAKASAAEARAWLGGAVPSGVESFMAVNSSDPRDLAAFLGSAAAEEMPATLRQNLLSRLQRQDPDMALELVRSDAVDPFANPTELVPHLHARGERGLQEWLAVLPAAAQREDLLKQFYSAGSMPLSAEALAAAAANALSHGPDGDAAAVAVLGRRAGTVAQAVPEVFGALPFDAQTRLRMDLVMEMGRHSPDVAAELWMDATPEELDRPGATAVAEGIAGQLLRRDPEVGSAWIQQLPPGESRDRAVARMIEMMAAKDPVTSTEWAATLADPEAQQRARRALESPTPHRFAR